MRKILFFYCLLSSKLLFAQEYPVLSYTIKEGLAAMQVTCVFTDSRGILWVGTKNGLSRYNGEKFTNYTTQNGLNSGYISAISEDSKGNIWFLAGRKGLCKYDGKEFHFIKNDKYVLNEMICIDDKDNVLVKNENGLLRVEKDSLVPFSFPQMPFKITGTGEFIYNKPLKSYFIADSASVIWQYNHHSYTNFQQTQGVYQVENQVFINEQDINNQLINYYIIQNNKPLKFLSINENNLTIEVHHPIPVNFFFRFNGNTYILEKNSKSYRKVLDTIYYNRTCISAGKSFYWIGTEKGLKAVATNGFRYFEEKEVPYCWGVVEDKFNRHIFVNYQSDLQLFDGKQIKKLEGYKNLVKNKTHDLYNEWYFDAVKDKFGNVWLPNVEGVYQYDGNKFEHFRTTLPISLAEDKFRNKILAACQKEIYSISSTMPHKIEKFTGKEELFDGYTMSICVDNKANYWLGGREIIKYNPDTQQKQVYNKNNKKFQSKGCITILQDKYGSIWAGTFDNGLFKYNIKTDSFEPILKDFIKGSISTIEIFDDNHLLIAGQLSLYLLNLSDFYHKNQVNIKAFNFHNGFIGLEPGQLGGYRDSKGYFWMTSGTVLSRINPKEIDYSNTPPKIYITSLNGSPLKFPDLQKNEIIDLPNDQNQVSIEMEALGENLPFRPQFSYQLNADSWSNWTESNVISINNLARGLYRFRVKCRTASYDNTQSEISSIQFHINIPFWKNPDFYQYVTALIFLLASIILGLAYFSWRERQKAVNKQHEFENQERKISFLQIQTLQAQMNPHFTFNVLGTMQKLILTQDTEKAHQNLLNLATLLRNYLDATITDSSKSKSLFSNEIALAKEIELLKMYLDFEQLQYKNRFKYEISIEKGISVEDYRIPPLIIQPFIENAVKHGVLNIEDDRIGNIWIRFEKINEDELCCLIEDDGIGIKKAEELQQKSLQKFKSRGTKLVKDRIAILNQLEYNIELSMTERPEGGTLVKLLIGYKFD